jgi:hypothetical protein
MGTLDRELTSQTLLCGTSKLLPIPWKTSADGLQFNRTSSEYIIASSHHVRFWGSIIWQSLVHICQNRSINNTRAFLENNITSNMCSSLLLTRLNSCFTCSKHFRHLQGHITPPHQFYTCISEQHPAKTWLL